MHPLLITINHWITLVIQEQTDSIKCFIFILFNTMYFVLLQDPVVNKGLLCLKSSTGNLTNTYTTALLAYTFSLAGENKIQEQLLKELDNVAISG